MNFAAPYERLGIATDAAAMHDRLETCLRSGELVSGPIKRLIVSRIIPRKSGEVLIQYRVSAPGMAWTSSDELTIYGEFFPDHITPPVAKKRDEGATNHLTDLRLRVWLFPRDPSLRHLDSLLDGQKFARDYADALGASALGFRPSSEEHRVDILGYRLGRRLVAHLSFRDERASADQPGKDIVVKMCRPGSALTLWTRHRQLEHESLDWCGKNDSFLPSQYLMHEQTGAVFQESRSGASLHEIMTKPSFVDGCHAAMEILTTMQHFHITGLPVHRVSDELEHLDWLIELTGQAFPLMLPELIMARDEMHRRAPEDVTDRVVCHRDFYDKQVLFDGNRSTVIDFDTLAESDPALDFGNFIAHLQWRKFQSPESSVFLQQGGDVVRQSMLREDAALGERLNWWISVAALRIACIYLWRPRWHNQAITFLIQQVQNTSEIVQRSFDR